MHRDPLGRLYWRTRAEGITALLRDEVEELRAIAAAPAPVMPSAPVASAAPAVKTGAAETGAAETGAAETGAAVEGAAVEGTAAAAGATGATPERTVSTAAISHPPSEADLTAATRVLVQLGHGKSEARVRVARALVLLASSGLGRPPTAEELINTSIRQEAVVLRVPRSPRGERGELRRPDGPASGASGDPSGPSASGKLEDDPPRSDDRRGASGG